MSTDAFKRFGSAALQALITDEQLERISRLLPGIDDPQLDPNRIYAVSELARIFDAFGAERNLRDKLFRAKLFACQPSEILDELIRRVGDGGRQIVTHDEKVNYLVTLGWKPDEFASHACEVLGISKEHIPSKVEELPALERIPLNPTKFKQLKDYQQSVLAAAQRRLAIPRSRFVVQMPTGSGKTRTAMEIVANELNDMPPGSVCVWVAHSEELCQQAHAAFKDVWPFLANKDINLVRIWGKANGLALAPKDTSIFAIASFAKLYNLTERNELPLGIQDRIGLIVVDEAHKVIARTYRTAVLRLSGDNTRVIGLTATPGRSTVNAQENEDFASFFFEEMVGIQPPENLSVIQFLQQRGVLSQVTYVPIISDTNIPLSATQRTYLETFFDLPADVLKSVGQDDARNLEIVKRIRREVDSGGRIIFFGCSVDHSRFISSLLNLLGTPSCHVDGEVSPSRRAKLIADFKLGSLKVLCNFGVLSTGFDAPQVDVVFIARPTASVVLYSQMIGRGLRGPAIGGTPRCKVIDVRDNIVGYQGVDNVYDYFSDYFQVQ